MDTPQMPESKTLTQEGNTANFSGFPRILHSINDTWQCRTCKYWPNVDTQSPQCIGCGRDFWGAPGQRPEGADLIQHSRESGEF